MTVFESGSAGVRSNSNIAVARSIDRANLRWSSRPPGGVSPSPPSGSSASSRLRRRRRSPTAHGPRTAAAAAGGAALLPGRRRRRPASAPRSRRISLCESHRSGWVCITRRWPSVRGRAPEGLSVHLVRNGLSTFPQANLQERRGHRVASSICSVREVVSELVNVAPPLPSSPTCMRGPPPSCMLSVRPRPQAECTRCQRSAGAAASLARTSVRLASCRCGPAACAAGMGKRE